MPQDLLNPSGRGDTERLNWLDSQKREHHAHWDDKWVNPSVSWHVKQYVNNGTYEYPTELKNLSIRDVIDAAMQTK